MAERWINIAPEQDNECTLLSVPTEYKRICVEHSTFATRLTSSYVICSNKDTVSGLAVAMGLLLRNFAVDYCHQTIVSLAFAEARPLNSMEVGGGWPSSLCGWPILCHPSEIWYHLWLTDLAGEAISFHLVFATKHSSYSSFSTDQGTNEIYFQVSPLQLNNWKLENDY